MTSMFTFVSGNLALDFAGTVKHRSTTYIDGLTTADALAEWLVDAGLLDTAACAPPQLEHAVRLREAIYRMGVAAAANAPIAAADRRWINDCARGELPTVTLRSDDTIARAGTPEAALTAIARAAVELFGGGDRVRVKQCSRPSCTRLYLDTSRGGTRRWCDMTLCGNRAKSAAFRAKHA
ncbi:CGNR zinc finger domain-containing protein [Nocardia sp. NPDC127579]|uniref:CGNR zinc finger domain-containing protein n=1 Tax=Nocardia sp. NPDC127579 TaxID=3345402 RepID=UPI00363CC6F1